jgi:hypothetical protein
VCAHFVNRKTVLPLFLSSSIIVLLLFTGCGMTADNLTKERIGRRVGDYDVDGLKIAYVWYPAQHDSTQGHLVLLDQTGGTEKELESDLSGPMAMCRGRVLWWNARARDKAGESDLMVYNIEEDNKEVLSRGRVQALDADGDHVVWCEYYKSFGSDIVLHDFETGDTKPISSGGKEGDMMHRDPRIGDGTVVWEAYDRNARISEIAIYDISTGELSTIDVPQDRPHQCVSGDRLVYCLRTDGQQEIRLYDIPSKKDTVVATLERLRTYPYIEGDKIAWCEHVRKDEFKGIPGQPLMDEKDIRDVFVYHINSGSKRTLAKYLLATGSRISIHDGRVYLTVYRDYPPPGSSNLVVPVDLWVW